MRTLFWHGRLLVSFLGACAGFKGPPFGLKGSSFSQRVPTFSLWGSLYWPENGPFRLTKRPSSRQRALCWPVRNMCRFGRPFVGPRGPSVGLKNPLSVCQGPLPPKMSLCWPERSLCCSERAFFWSKSQRGHSVGMRKLCAALRGFLSA